MFSIKFVKDSLERAVKTAAQAAVALFGADQVNLFEVDFGELAGVSLGAALLSVLSSLASKRAGGDQDSASLNK